MPFVFRCPAFLLMWIAGFALTQPLATDAQERVPDAASTSTAGPTKDTVARFPVQLRENWNPRPEWAQMLAAILRGQPMGPNSGWFNPSEATLGWKWFARQFDSDGDGKVTEIEGKRFTKVFGIIDRNRDGFITAVDFDWNKVSHVVPATPSQALFLMLDQDSNGRVDQQEVQQWMARLDQSGQGYLTPDEMTRGLAMLDQFAANQREDNSAKPSKPTPPQKKSQAAADPTPMLNMLFEGHLGTFTEGPEIGGMAPDFDLPQLKAQERIRLSTFLNKKIVVLNFGSFT